MKGHPEPTVKRILVPVDFSPSSRKALNYAAGLAKQFSAGLTLLHVIEPYHFASRVESPLDYVNLKQAAMEEMARWAASIRRRTACVETAVAIGTAYEVIVTKARKNRIDLIILSTHGRTGLKHFLLGSVAERVVRLAPCPVLVVREKE